MGSLLQELLLAFLVCFVHGQSKDGYTDENRPYEFGFMIDGEQHRHEKKDEKGIIMGEFGFITADGIYHVTVYATDENGSFKILKMTNIKVGFPPGKATTTTTPAPKQQTQLNGFRGCSGCLIPDASKPNVVPGAQSPGGTAPLRSGGTSSDSQPKLDPRIQPSSGTGPADRLGINDYNKPSAAPSKSVGGIDEKLNNLGTPYIQPANDNLSNKGGHLTPVKEATKSNLIPDKVSPSSGKSQFSEMEMRILDYMARLYKFNYTLSYHGHEETGDVGGNKNGSYFSNGRDGYQRKVVYIANEFGYQPKVSLVKLDPESTPNEQTEKELTQLKGNEFIWFYKKK